MNDVGRHSQPRYELVREVLRDAIRSGKAPDGLVLLEGRLAEIFNTSRATVRRSLEMLYSEGLIQRFDGRGFIIDPDGRDPIPRRTELTKEAIGLQTALDLSHGITTSDLLLRSIESEITVFLPFGTFRVGEQILADEHNVSRQVIREVLSRLRDRGLVQKDPQSHWTIGPLTARNLADDYEIRRLLEPQALKESAPSLPVDEVLGYIANLERAKTATNGSVQADIENDLHARCLRFCANRKILTILAHATLPTAVNLVFLRLFGPDSPSIEEHRLVLDHLAHGSVNAASASLEAHLDRSKRRALQRMKTLSVFPEPALPAYLTSI